MVIQLYFATPILELRLFILYCFEVRQLSILIQMKRENEKNRGKL
jgi:hypothetical protein